MSLIVAGRFDTFPAAEAAAQRLFLAGFPEEDVALLFVNPPGMHDRTPIGGDRMADTGARAGHKGAAWGVILGAALGGAVGAGLAHWANWMGAWPWLVAMGAGVGAYLGSLSGTMATVRSGSPVVPQAVPGTRSSGVLLAVHVTAESQTMAIDRLRDAGAQDVERAHGRWAQGRWQDFDPTQAVVPASRTGNGPLA